jgi:dihydroflavonol-4-reductase
MDVTVTGGTGFVGAHTVGELVRQGHRVRVLAREPARLPAALVPLGVDPGAVDVVAGEITDEAAVAAAVRGADAVLHAAAVYSFDSRRRAELRRVNERGTEVVLEATRRAGTGRIVHVSTVGALYPAREAELGPGSPVGDPAEPYLAGKAAADRIARGHAAAGEPVVISYPPALLGPGDPRVGDQNARLRDVLRGLMPFWPDGGLPLGDVRDTATLHAELLTSTDVTAQRFFAPGRLVAARDYLALLRSVTGRALPAWFLPPRAMVPVGRLADLVQRCWPWHIPAEYGAIYVCAVAAPVAAGVSPPPARPLRETITDTVRWLHEAGQLTERQAGTAMTVPGTTASGPAGTAEAGRGWAR